jgi:hypothetical protein
MLFYVDNQANDKKIEKWRDGIVSFLNSYYGQSSTYAFAETIDTISVEQDPSLERVMQKAIKYGQMLAVQDKEMLAGLHVARLKILYLHLRENLGNLAVCEPPHVVFGDDDPIWQEVESIRLSCSKVHERRNLNLATPITWLIRKKSSPSPSTQKESMSKEKSHHPLLHRLKR